MANNLVLSRNPISRFAKLNHGYFCVQAYLVGDIKNFCRHFFCHVMDRNGLVTFDEPVGIVIKRLTGWGKNSISRALRELADFGELTRPKESRKVVIMNDLIFNRQGAVVSSNKLYRGIDPVYDEKQRRILTAMNEIIKQNKRDEKMEQVIIEANEELLAENQRLKMENAELRGTNKGLKESFDLLAHSKAAAESGSRPNLRVLKKNLSEKV